MKPSRTPRTAFDLAPGDHLCCLYDSDQDQLSLLTCFIRQGLERNHKVACIVDARVVPSIVHHLQDDGLAVDEYLRWGHLVILTDDDTYTREGKFDSGKMIAQLHAKTTRALDEGYQALRVASDMTLALRGCPCSKQIIEYESRLNEFFSSSQCIAICQYDRRQLDPQVLMDVLRTHPIAAIGNEIYDNLYYVPPTDSSDTDPRENELRVWIANLTERKQAGQTHTQWMNQTPQAEATTCSGLTSTRTAHRLRNLLGVISANAQLLVEHPEARDLQDQCAQKIYQATGRASLVIEDTMEFARSQGDGIHTPSVNTVLDEALALVVHELVLECLTLRRTLRPDQPDTGVGPDQFQRVFIDLVLRALSTIPQYGVFLVGNHGKEDGKAEMHFEDDGGDSGSKDVSRVVAPLHPADTKGDCIGPCLCASHRPVQHHRKTVKAIGQARTGDTLTVRLPGVEVA